MVPFLYQVHEAPHDYYRYTRHALERLVSDAGLRMVELSPYGGYPDVLCDLLNKALASVPPLCHLFLALASWASRRRLYRRWSSGTAERFPLGYCLVAEKG